MAHRPGAVSAGDHGRAQPEPSMRAGCADERGAVGQDQHPGELIGYIIDLDPGPLLLVQPREADCEAFSKDRLAPMLRDSAALRGKIADARSRDSNNTILHKKFTGWSITMSAASSPAGL